MKYNIKTAAYFFTCMILITSQFTVYSAELLKSGPMVGYTEMRDVMLWVQTTEEAKVQYKYYPENSPKQVSKSVIERTNVKNGFVAHTLLENLTPDTKYIYQLYLNGKQVKRDYPMYFKTQAWRNHREENPKDFSFVIGSCAYITEAKLMGSENPYGGDYKIFTSINDTNPDMMLWLGDNIYFTAADWNSRSGMIARYSFARALPELQPLLASTAHYAIWDDHDFGPNNSDRSFWNKDYALETFKLFWANPNYGVMDKPGITSFFQWNDAHFFLIDNRYYRTPNNRKTEDKVQWGDHQFEWLIDALSSSRAPFKFVATGGQVLSTLKKHETFINYHPEERERLLKAIKDHEITGVIFLSGDRHFSEIGKLEREGTYPLYEFTSSPLSSGAYSAAREREAHDLQIKDSVVTVRNFAKINISGEKQNRNLNIKYYDVNGKELYSFDLNENDLK